MVKFPHPYEAEKFSGVIATQTIHHTTTTNIRGIANEIQSNMLRKEGDTYSYKYLQGQSF